MIKQIQTIPGRNRSAATGSMFSNVDFSLRQLSRHFEHCLRALEEPARRARMTDVRANPRPQPYNHASK